MSIEQFEKLGLLEGLSEEVIEQLKEMAIFNSHDISHCANTDCPKKTTCHRYIMHLDAQRRDLSYLTYFITDAMPKDGNCEVYWPI